MYTPKRQCHSPDGTERLSGTVCSDTTQKLLRDRPKNVNPAYRFSKSVFEGSSAGSAAEYFSKTQAADVSLWPYSVGHVLPRVTCKLDEFGSVSQASNVCWTECLNSKNILFICFFGRWTFEVQLTDEMMTEDLLSKREAKAPVWQYFWFHPGADGKSDNVSGRGGVSYLTEKLVGCSLEMTVVFFRPAGTFLMSNSQLDFK